MHEHDVTNDDFKMIIRGPGLLRGIIDVISSYCCIKSIHSKVTDAVLPHSSRPVRCIVVYSITALAFNLRS